MSRTPSTPVLASAKPSPPPVQPLTWPTSQIRSIDPRTRHLLQHLGQLEAHEAWCEAQVQRRLAERTDLASFGVADADRRAVDGARHTLCVSVIAESLQRRIRRDDPPPRGTKARGWWRHYFAIAAEEDGYADDLAMLVARRRAHDWLTPPEVEMLNALRSIGASMSPTQFAWTCSAWQAEKRPPAALAWLIGGGLARAVTMPNEGLSLDASDRHQEFVRECATMLVEVVPVASDVDERHPSLAWPRTRDGDHDHEREPDIAQRLELTPIRTPKE